MVAGRAIAIGGKKYGQMKDGIRLGREVMVSFQASPAIPLNSPLKVNLPVLCLCRKMALEDLSDFRTLLARIYCG